MLENILIAERNGVFFVHIGEGFFIKTIKYVHELQNLIFALTNEELTINE